MKIWVDDIRHAPEGSEWAWAQSVNEAIQFIKRYHKPSCSLDLLDLDHDAGDYVNGGGDYIKILDYLEENNINNIPIRIHSQNPVGVENMRRIIERNGWKEIK